MKKKLKYLLIIILLVLFLPYIEIENFDERNRTTTLEYKNLVSYFWDDAVKWYVKQKEKRNEQRSSEKRDESTGKNRTKQHPQKRMGD